MGPSDRSSPEDDDPAAALDGVTVSLKRFFDLFPDQEPSEDPPAGSED